MSLRATRKILWNISMRSCSCWNQEWSATGDRAWRLSYLVTRVHVDALAVAMKGASVLNMIRRYRRCKPGSNQHCSIAGAVQLRESLYLPVHRRTVTSSGGRPCEDCLPGRFSVVLNNLGQPLVSPFWPSVMSSIEKGTT